MLTSSIISVAGWSLVLVKMVAVGYVHHERSRMSRPALVVIGGPPGSGKSVHAQRLSTELGYPCLSSDALGRMISASDGFRGSTGDAWRAAYDVVFGLCHDFVGHGVSVVLDISLGWQFHWQQLDAIRARDPEVKWLPIVLRCPRAVCFDRIAQRHASDPATYASAEWFASNANAQSVWDYLESLDRQDARVLGADRPMETVYLDIKTLARGTRSVWARGL
jgi:predicted kinase